MTNRSIMMGVASHVTYSYRSLEIQESLPVGDGRALVKKLEESVEGVWASFRSSSLLSLYHAQHFVLLLNIDCSTLLPQEIKPTETVSRLKTSQPIMLLI